MAGAAQLAARLHAAIDKSERHAEMRNPSFPCYVMPIDALLLQESFVTHEDCFSSLVEWREGMGAVVFVSQAWLSREHPDPHGLKFRLLRDFLTAAREGHEAVTPFWLEAWFNNGQGVDAQELRTIQYVWFDLQSVPQRCSKAKERAVGCLPSYVALSSFFLCLVPPTLHANGTSLVDYSFWCSRGWCRMERLANILSLTVQPVIILESMNSKYTAMSRDWLLQPVGRGDFTLDEDRAALAPVIDSLLAKRQAHALSIGDLLTYRLLVATFPVYSDGLPSLDAKERISEGPQPSTTEGFDAWMRRMLFEGVHDEAASGWTPLRMSLYMGRLDVARELLSRGAGVDAPLRDALPGWGYHHKGCTILCGLSFLRDDARDAIGLLVEHGAQPLRGMTGKVGLSPVHLAAGAGRKANLDALVDLVGRSCIWHADEGFAMYPWRVAVLWGQSEMLKHVFRKHRAAGSFEPRGYNRLGFPMAFVACNDAGDVATLLEVVVQLGFDINEPVLASKMDWSVYLLVLRCQLVCRLARHPDNVSDFFSNCLGSTALMSSALLGKLGLVLACLSCCP